MRKILCMMLLAIAVLASGCGSEGTKTPQESQKTEDEKKDENTVAENTEQGNEGTEQSLVSDDDASDRLSEYMASVKEQSDILKDSLENDELTQDEMNRKSQELYELWDGALNYLWDELKDRLSEDEFAKQLDEQRVWIAEKENEVKEAGKEVEGGSIYALTTNVAAAKITEERVYELYGQLE